jgi:CheY-like chemotaxis protein
MIAGKLVLVVEDEPIVAMMIEDLLDDLGARTVGPAFSIAEAISLIETSAIDAAILDVNVGEEHSHGIADRLRARGVPFVFATGYGREGCGYDGAEVIEKPFRREHVAAALERAFRISG